MHLGAVVRQHERMTTTSRTRYPSDVFDDEWAFSAPCLALIREDAP